MLVGCEPSVAIHEAARTGNIEAVKQHLAEGADVNAENIFDKTPLHRASLGRYKEVTELLITKGADVNVQDINGSTSLDWAVVPTAVNKTETSNLLRKHGGQTGEELKAAAN